MCVRQRVPELAAFVDRAGCLRSRMAGNAAREGELPEQFSQAVQVLADVCVEAAVAAFQVGVGHHPGAAVSGARDQHDIGITLADNAIEMCIDDVEAGRRAPVSQQAGLDVACGERIAQQGIVQQVDLAHRQVVRGAPVGVDLSDFLRGERARVCRNL